MDINDLVKQAKGLDYWINILQERHEKGNETLHKILKEGMDLSANSIHILKAIIEQEQKNYAFKVEMDSLKEQNLRLKSEIEEYRMKNKQLEAIAEVWKERWLTSISSSKNG